MPFGFITFANTKFCPIAVLLLNPRFFLVSLHIVSFFSPPPRSFDISTSSVSFPPVFKVFGIFQLSFLFRFYPHCVSPKTFLNTYHFLSYSCSNERFGDVLSFVLNIFFFRLCSFLIFIPNTLPTTLFPCLVIPRSLICSEKEELFIFSSAKYYPI